jgi:hypothetical protein
MDLPPLSDAERAGLKESIERDGVRYPVLLDPDGLVIDGNNRLSVCEELGIKCPTVTLDVDDLTAERLRITLNLYRRHLDENRQNKLSLILEMRDMNMSERQIGKALGISGSAVHQQLERSTAKRLAVDHVVGADGKMRAARTRDYAGEYDRRNKRRIEERRQEKLRDEIRTQERRIGQRDADRLERAAAAAPEGKLNLPALRMARDIRAQLRKLANLVPAERFVTQIPDLALREFIPGDVSWWLDVAALCESRLAELPDLPPAS